MYKTVPPALYRSALALSLDSYAQLFWRPVIENQVPVVVFCSCLLSKSLGGELLANCIRTAVCQPATVVTKKEYTRLTELSSH